MNNRAIGIAQAGRSISADFRALVGHTEQLLQATATTSGAGVERVRNRISDSLRHSKTRLAALETRALRKGRSAVSATRRRIRERPWQALAIAAMGGAFLALVIRRRPEPRAVDPS